MFRIYFVLLACLVLAFCQSDQQPQQAQSAGLQKIYYKNQEEIQKLRDAGAEIIVQEPDYVVIRTDKMMQTQGLKSEPIQEIDLVQRLVKVHLKDSTDLQKVVDTGVDLWEVKNNTAVVRAFDLYIEKMKQAGLSVKIIAKNASKMEEQD